MSVFGSILNRVFGRASSRPPVQNTAAPGTQASATPAATSAAAGGPGAAGGVAPDPATGGTGTAAPTMATPQAAPQPAAPLPTTAGAPVDVEAVLTDLASKNPQTLNWRQSIVDLMKLLDLDSSLQNRKELAKELGYTGDTNDSATMNVWLHKQVMRKLAENGGHVPASLKD